MSQQPHAQTSDGPSSRVSVDGWFGAITAETAGGRYQSGRAGVKAT